jgi:hypothetical protein
MNKEKKDAKEKMRVRKNPSFDCTSPSHLARWTCEEIIFHCLEDDVGYCLQGSGCPANVPGSDPGCLRIKDHCLHECVEQTSPTAVDCSNYLARPKTPPQVSQEQCQKVKSACLNGGMTSCLLDGQCSMEGAQTQLCQDVKSHCFKLCVTHSLPEGADCSRYIPELSQTQHQKPTPPPHHKPPPPHHHHHHHHH